MSGRLGGPRRGPYRCVPVHKEGQVGSAQQDLSCGNTELRKDHGQKQVRAPDATIEQDVQWGVGVVSEHARGARYHAGPLYPLTPLQVGQIRTLELTGDNRI